VHDGGVFFDGGAGPLCGSVGSLHGGDTAQRGPM
jgi:hypothetical protein